MITACGRSLPLPATLMRCPMCHRGSLVWDGRWAWRCTDRVCQHGNSLHALVEGDRDLEFSLQLGRRRDLRLSRYALEMVGLGAIVLEWLSADDAWRLRYRAPFPDDGRDLDELDRIVRERIWRRRSADEITRERVA